MKRKSLVLVSIVGILSLLLTGFAAPPTIEAAPTQDDSPVIVDTARPITEIINEKSAYLATVSPDGQYIAWGKQSGRGKDRVLQLCLFSAYAATHDAIEAMKIGAEDYIMKP
ncbi:MAG: hypothetical protein R6W76_08095, partial [Caldilinea sp.]